MRNIDEHIITAEVIGRQSADANPRLKQIISSLVHHLHDFARETRLTEAEWMTAIRFLTEVGHITDDKRQEFILLSDTLGLSMLVTAMNEARPQGCTEATVFGPFHVENSQRFANGSDISNGAVGEPCYVQARVLDRAHKPIAGAEVEVWQADADGFYDVQRDGGEIHRARGTLSSDEEGRVYFRSILAEAYPIPHDGPVGRMLAALGRHPWRPAHLHFRIAKPGYATLVTHVFRADGQYLDSDAVFGVRSSLIADWVRHEQGSPPFGPACAGPFYTLQFDFVMAESD